MRFWKRINSNEVIRYLVRFHSFEQNFSKSFGKIFLLATIAIINLLETASSESKPITITSSIPSYFNKIFRSPKEQSLDLLNL